jgi:ribosomal protein S18 acetylase RimI-like enzyme
MSYGIRPLREDDFAAARARIDTWFGRPVQHALARLFFVHFLPMSKAANATSELIGFILGFQSQTHPSVAYVHFIAVAPDYRQRGLARALYEQFFEEARARGCTHVETTTSPSNGASIAFHSRVGFALVPSAEAIDGVPVYLDYDGEGRHRVRLRRQL